MRRSLGQLAGQLVRQLGAETSSAGSCGPSTSGRVDPSAWVAWRQRWVSTGAAAAASGTTATAATAAAAATGGRRGPPTGMRAVRLLLHDYKQLSKARLSALVVATAAAGYAAGSREAIDWGGMGWTALGTMLASSSANALNQAYEKVNDGLMKRTMNRPLPTGRLSRAHALAFAATCGIGGVWLLAEKVRASGLLESKGASSGRSVAAKRAWASWLSAGRCMLLPPPSDADPNRRRPPTPPPPAARTGQPDHGCPGSRQHCSVCGRVHPAQAAVGA